MQLHDCVCYVCTGSRYHEEDDAQTFADWGVDFLKYDNCWAPASDWVIDRYTAMHAALNKTERPILYSMCDWGVRTVSLKSKAILTIESSTSGVE